MATVRIPLVGRKHPGLFALIDEADLPIVSEYRWYAVLVRNTFYALTTKDVDGRPLAMHRLISKPEPGYEPDHINHDGLDNRRGNLRNLTHAHNLQNQRGPQKGQSHGFVGISQDKNRLNQKCSWVAHVQVNGKAKHIGRYATAEDAARARDKAALEFYGPHAHLNFPDQEGAH